MKRIMQMGLSVVLLLALVGCNLSMGTNNPLGIDISSSVPEEPTNQVPVFDMTVQELISKLQKEKGEKGSDIFQNEVYTRLFTEQEIEYREHRYRTTDKLTYYIREVVATGKISNIEVEIPVKVSENSPAMEEYYDYMFSSFVVLLDVQEDYLLAELTQNYKYVQTKAQTMEYAQETIHYKNSYCVFREDIAKNRSVTILAVSENQEWQPLSYFDGENYHLYVDEQNKPIAYTTENLERLAFAYTEEGKPLPEKLKNDLGIVDVPAIDKPAESSAASEKIGADISATAEESSAESTETEVLNPESKVSEPSAPESPASSSQQEEAAEPAVMIHKQLPVAKAN